MADVKYDINGNDIMTKVLDELICAFPGWSEEEPVFSSVGQEEGVGWYPVSGAIIEYEKRNVLGGVYQRCQYPLYVMYRFANGSEKIRINVKEKLDMLGAWLEKKEITVGGKVYKLTEYPKVGDRVITNITRTTPSYNVNNYDSGVSDWVVYISVQYENSYTL